MVALENLDIVEHLVKVIILVYGIEVSDNGIDGEFAAQPLQGFNSTASSLRSNNQSFYFFHVNELFNAFVAKSWLVTYSYPKTVYQHHETLYGGQRAFDTEIAKDETLQNNFVAFDFELIFGKQSSLIDTKIASWVGKHEQASVSVSRNQLQEHLFNPRRRISLTN